MFPHLSDRVERLPRRTLCPVFDGLTVSRFTCLPEDLFFHSGVFAGREESY